MVRTQAEIQVAHDTLYALFMGEVPYVLDEASRPLIHASLDVLCWVLGHNHDGDSGFHVTLARIETALADRGWVRQKSAVPFTGPRPNEG